MDLTQLTRASPRLRMSPSVPPPQDPRRAPLVIGSLKRLRARISPIEALDPPPSAAEVRLFDSTRLGVVHQEWGLLFAAFLGVAAVWWLFDPLVFTPEIAKIYGAMRLQMVIVFSVALLLRRFLKPGWASVIVGVGAIVACFWAMGVAMGQLPGLLGIQYLYFGPVLAVAAPVRAGPRLVQALLFAVTPWAGALYSLGGVLPEEAKGTLASTLAFVGLAMLLGEWLFQFVEANHINGQRLAVLRDRLGERVDEQAGELRALAHELLMARDSERRWLSQELHDALGQELTSMSQTTALATLQFNRGLVEDASVTLEDVSTLIDRVHETMRRIVSRMRPVVVEQLGLPDALQSLVDEVNGQGGLHAELHLEGLGSGEPSPVVADTIYRVVQEALHNVVRHSSAARVDVRLEVGTDESHLSVVDDGTPTGPHLDPRSTHLGLIGIRERVIGCGGHSHWGPRPDGGFGVEVTLPQAAPRGDTGAQGHRLASERGSQ